MLSASRTGVRYHPMIVRYCLSVHSKSDSDYQEWRNSLERKKGGF